MEYPKINSVYERDNKGRFTDKYACDEFTYLAMLPWQWTEKVDGTNIRLYYPGPDHVDEFRGNEHAYIKGRTDNAQLPPKLLNACVELLRAMPLEKVFTGPAVLYGEGYGAGIQKGGQYRPDPSFVLFDVRVGDWWLRRPDVEDVANNLGIMVVPVVAVTSLEQAIVAMREQAAGGRVWLESAWSGATPEGIVGRPVVDLWDRRGDRITTKLKFKDFR